MPATRPTNADPKPKHDEDTNFIDPTSTPFSIHFDKLVIAVGAYSQSDLVFLFYLSQLLNSCCSFQRTRGERTCSFSERCQRRPQNTESYPGVFVKRVMLSHVV
jgi:NADPH-dependent 2,4-dienoyl-CoA reductase/sulfur reductase-like enzyme